MLRNLSNNVCALASEIEQTFHPETCPSFFNFFSSISRRDAVAKTPNLDAVPIAKPQLKGLTALVVVVQPQDLNAVLMEKLTQKETILKVVIHCHLCRLLMFVAFPKTAVKAEIILPFGSLIWNMEVVQGSTFITLLRVLFQLIELLF